MYSYERLTQAIPYEKRITPMGRFNVQNESDRGVSLSKRLNSFLNLDVAFPQEYSSRAPMLNQNPINNRKGTNSCSESDSEGSETPDAL